MSFESQAVRNSRTKFVKTVVFDVLLALALPRSIHHRTLSGLHSDLFSV